MIQKRAKAPAPSAVMTRVRHDVRHATPWTKTALNWSVLTVLHRGLPGFSENERAPSLENLSTSEVWRA